MFRQFKIGIRISAAFAGIFILTIISLLMISLSGLSSVIDNAEQRELQSHLNAFHGLIESQGKLAVIQSKIIANLPAVKSSFAKKNREELLSIVNEPYLLLKKEYGVRQFQFHTPPATSYLRVHKPKKFGDDLSSFRHTFL